MSIRTSRLVLFTVSVVLALPATALAREVAGAIQPDRHHQRGRTQTAGNSGRHRGRPQTETYNLRGTVSGVDLASNSVVVTITQANHGGRSGRALLGHSLTVDVSRARSDVADVNGDGSRDLGDVAVGDRVEVRVSLPRPLPATISGTVTAQRLRDDSAR